jgi:uncharacterized protein (TIGR03435 family)
VNCQFLSGIIHQAYLAYAHGGSFNLFVTTPIEGGPDWIYKERYAINAKTESEVSRELMNGPMLQALLEERFKLKVHFETRQMPVYVVTVAKGGLKLRRHEEGSCVPPPPIDLERRTPPPPLQPGQRRCAMLGTLVGPVRSINAEGITLERFLQMFLGEPAGFDKPMIDETSLKDELFDFHLQYANPDLRGPVDTEPSAAPSITTALQELGLRVESTKGPREFLVIDHVERPDDN